MDSLIEMFLKELPVAGAMIAVVVLFLRHLAQERRAARELQAEVMEVIDRNTQAWTRAEAALERRVR